MFVYVFLKWYLKQLGLILLVDLKKSLESYFF